MKTNRLVIFDGNHLMYRAYYKFAKLKTIEGVLTSVIYGGIRVLESLIRRMDAAEVVVVFDGSRSKYRQEILPEYKQREKKLGWDAEDFFRQRDVLMKMLQMLGIKVVRDKDYEADDIITLVIKKEPRDREIVIISGDKDFNQLITPTVSVFNPNRKTNNMLTHSNLQKLLGYTPKQTVDYLSLLGDSSDKIPGYHGIGEKKALNLLDTYGSIKKFLASGDKFGKVDHDKLKALHKKNKRLIDLKYYYRKFLRKKPIPYLNPEPKQDLKAFEKQCRVYETNSFLKVQFIKTFKNLYNGEQV